MAVCLAAAHNPVIYALLTPHLGTGAQVLCPRPARNAGLFISNADEIYERKFI
eukprot:CAMPEP_0185731406 /NCGR_PEP_ID=MMETSP1171-20130828/12811_1 /TAXON_ID=374046 /ORGANISM="Helicotheca tamensis, Strain CCMP826" /LENGTH=52 /DNA_ID=CAMNT_0028400665 /DNA_START=308 /DNA_END=466 /DNA_ORIENTATION=-